MGTSGGDGRRRHDRAVLRSGVSRAVAGAGPEERYLCSSPYGDTFDVLVNDADRTSWHGYPVILAVGDIAWTPDDVRFLLDHARAGGIVALNEIHLAGWDREALGLAAEGFAPTGGARVVLASTDGAALAIRRDVGRGCLLVIRAAINGNQGREPAFPQELLEELAERYLPFRVSGDVQTLLNRTPEGWAVIVVNNMGITKDLHVDRPPTVDASATQPVVISFREPPAAVSDLITGDALAMDVAGGRVLRFVLPPGEMRLVAVKE